MAAKPPTPNGDTVASAAAGNHDIGITVFNHAPADRPMHANPLYRP
jgi:hypothetical protein